MTQDELDALPIDGDLTYSEEVREGRLVRVPMMQTVGALFQGHDDAMLIQDRRGEWWTTGWAGGTLYKRRMANGRAGRTWTSGRQVLR